MDPKVLVAVVTFAGKRDRLVPLLQGLQRQTFKEFDLLFVDNSEALGYEKVLAQALEAAFPARSRTVCRLRIEGDRYVRIKGSREEALRYLACHPEYSHLLFLDSDIVLPPHALEALLAARSPLASGVFLSWFPNKEGRTEPMPLVYRDMEADAQYGNRVEGDLCPYSIASVLYREILPIGAAGFACTLVERELAGRIPLRLNEIGAGEDFLFYRDAIRLGARPVAVCSVRCKHLVFAPGDPRNEPLDLDNYRLEPGSDPSREPRLVYLPRKNVPLAASRRA